MKRLIVRHFRLSIFDFRVSGGLAGCCLCLLCIGIGAAIAAEVAVAIGAEQQAQFMPPPEANGAAKSAFRFVDVYLDSGRAPLAAYEFEMKIAQGDVRIVGVERGDAKGFQDPPYYDPAALSQHRIVIGAFDTGDDLPAGKTRVARLHVYVAGDQLPEYTVVVITAGSKEGKPIAATASFVEGEAK